MRTLIGYGIAVAVLAATAWFGVQADHKAFVGSLFAALLSVFVVFFMEIQSRPELSITEEPAPPPIPGSKFLRVLVENRRLWWPLSIFLERRPAYQARAFITFLTEENNPVFGGGRQVTGRWANTPEPVRPLSVVPTGPGGAPAIHVLRDMSVTRDAVDIASGSREPLDIVVRSEAEQGCRGWHNRIIDHPAPPPEDRFELPRGRYHALVRVDASGRSFKALFRIVCDLGVEEFRLERIKRVPRGL